tara:strand:- start:1 stop:273 length:273 start_codon:yes stop_codon:yes gene_type:complete
MSDPNPVNSIESTPADRLKQMDSSVAAIDRVIDGTYPDVAGPTDFASIVGSNVRHLELMTGTRVGELGESPDLSSYETAITAGRAYLESA